MCSGTSARPSPAWAGALLSSLKPENSFPFSMSSRASGPERCGQGWVVSGHLVGKKAWQDLACLFKNKVWVKGVGNYSAFCLSLSLHFLFQKWKEITSELVSACPFAASREQRGLWAGGSRKSRLGPLSSLDTELGRAGPPPCYSSLRGDSVKKGQRQQRAGILGAMRSSPLVHAVPEAEPTPWAFLGVFRVD